MPEGSSDLKVLVVDDDFMVATIHAELVDETPGFRVAGTAGTGTQALTMAETLSPDLLLLDVHLPDMSGLEVLRLLRERGDDVDDEGPPLLESALGVGEIPERVVAAARISRQLLAEPRHLDLGEARMPGADGGDRPLHPPLGHLALDLQEGQEPRGGGTALLRHAVNGRRTVAPPAR